MSRKNVSKLTLDNIDDSVGVVSSIISDVSNILISPVFNVQGRGSKMQGRNLIYTKFFSNFCNA